ncbi:hypothetical protein ACPI6F_005011, partial [Citrobacter freundii]
AATSVVNAVPLPATASELCVRVKVPADMNTSRIQIIKNPPERVIFGVSLRAIRTGEVIFIHPSPVKGITGPVLSLISNFSHTVNLH